jgi:excisionase family DNA binding protein
MQERREGTELEFGAAVGELLKVEGLARLLQVSEAWVRKGILERTLPHTKIGRNIRFTPAQVQQIIQAGERPPTRPPVDGRSGRSSARTRL